MLYANDGDRPRQTLEAAAHVTSQAVWLDLLDPTEAERSAAERITGLRLPSREDIAEIENSSRVYAEAGALYLSMPYSYLAPGSHSQVTSIGFVVGPKVLITLRYAVLPSFESYAAQFHRRPAPTSGEALVGLLETMADRLADVLEHVAGRLESLSRETFRGEDGTVRRSERRADRELRAILTAVGHHGATLGNLRDSALGLSRIVGFLQQNPADLLPAGLQPRLATLRQDVASLNDYDAQLHNKVSFLLDAVLGFINIEQNNGVKVLTVVSVVGIPPTFVVGLYGMNFKTMPEYDWAHGYAYGWAMILVSILVPLVWFRVKGWI